MFWEYPDKRRFAILPMAAILLVGVITTGCEENQETGEEPGNSVEEEEPLVLPSKEEFADQLNVPLMDSLSQRRSVRDYSEEALTLKELAALLWSAQGITEEERGYRVAPSAGATYPMEVYVLAENVEGLNAGLYRYSPGSL
ncbi:SagB/ThcOx family dehydrogenase [Isachenkonia alkalipeptolytica]|nr:SagB/ThcOx family dehydrogenase [Isachenkonia alkalipeptolytica]